MSTPETGAEQQPIIQEAGLQEQEGQPQQQQQDQETSQPANDDDNTANPVELQTPEADVQTTTTTTAPVSKESAGDNDSKPKLQQRVRYSDQELLSLSRAEVRNLSPALKTKRAKLKKRISHKNEKEAKKAARAAAAAASAQADEPPKQVIKKEKRKYHKRQQQQQAPKKADAADDYGDDNNNEGLSDEQKLMLAQHEEKKKGRRIPVLLPKDSPVPQGDLYGQELDPKVGLHNEERPIMDIILPPDVQRHLANPDSAYMITITNINGGNMRFKILPVEKQQQMIQQTVAAADRVAATAAALTPLIQENEELHSTLESLHVEKKTLEDLLLHANNLAAQKDAEMQTLREALKVAQQKENQYREKERANEATIRQNADRISQTNKNIAEWESKYADLKNRTDTAIAQSFTTSEPLKKELEAVQARLASLTEQQAEKDREYQELYEFLKKKNREIDGLRSDLSDAKAALAEAPTTKQAEIIDSAWVEDEHLSRIKHKAQGGQSRLKLVIKGGMVTDVLEEQEASAAAAAPTIATPEG